MKNTLYRLLSALLALCMVVGTFTVIFTSTVLHAHADESEDAGVIKGETMNAPFEIGSLASTKYATPEDKLRTMSKVTALLDKNNNPLLDEYGQAVYEYNPWITSGDYELYVQDKSGEVAVRNKVTGQVIFSNPYDVRMNVDQASIYNKMFAQISLKYDIIKEGKSGELNSYQDAALYGNQIKVSYIKNGVCVEYTIGRADQRRLVPMVMEKYRWETVLYQKIEDEHIKKKFRAFYTLIDLNFEENPAAEVSRYESSYPVLKRYHADNPYISEGYDPNKEAEYAAQRVNYYASTSSSAPFGPEHYVYGIPYTGRMGLYVLGNARDQEKNRIEEYIRSWAPEYNYDTLAYDHELVQYTSIAAAIPLFKMALEYRLDETGFSVRLPANSITFDEDNFRLTSINVLPYMGAGNNENTGYVFVPDGSGTLIRFEDAKTQGSAILDNGMLYGPDNAYHSFAPNYTGKNEEMRYPVFGIIENDKVVYEKNETNGYLTEQCPHRYVTKVLKADCALGRDGGTYEYCAVCGHLNGITGRVPFEHVGTKEYIVETNCHTEGIYNLTCTTCGGRFENLKEEKTEHTLGAFTEADTENHICYEIQKCLVEGCDYVEEGEKVPTAHTYEEEWVEVRENGRCYRYNTCSLCGFYAEEDIDHDLGETTLVHNTETHRCYNEQICKDCGGVVREDVDHEFADPTYSETAEGLCAMSEICKNCGFDQITLDRHAASDNGVKKNDKTNHYCYTEFTCENCSTVYTEADDHSFENGKCTECGFAEEQETEKYVHENGVCYRVLCDKDGNEISRVAVDHVYGDNSYVGPTCTESGYNAFPCINCGYEANKHSDEDSEPALGHDHQWDSEEKTSCLEGYKSYLKCTLCGEVIDEKDAPADGHIYGEPECLLAETATNSGIYKYVCEFCGHNHIEVRDPVKEEAPEEEEGDDEAEGEEGEEGTTTDEPEKVTVEVPRSHGFLAIMTSGSALASLKAEYNSTHPYIFAYMTVNPRPQDSYNLKDASANGADAVWTVVSERKYSGSYTFKYIMLQDVDYSVAEGAEADKIYKSSTYDADYMGMAAAYREYLIKSGTLKPLDTNENGIPLYLEAFGATNISSSFLTFPTVETVPLTTFEDLKGIVNDLKAVVNEDGEVIYSITNVNLKLNGFTNGGMISTMPYKVEFEGVVGGNAGFTDFVSFAKDNKVGVYPDFDFAYVESTDWFDGYSDDEHAVKTIDGRYIAKRDYDPTYQLFSGTGLIAVSASVYDYFYNAFNKNYAKFENMGVSLGSLGTDLNSDFDDEDPYNREDSREFTERLLANMKKDYGSIMVDGGNMYTVPYVDHILNMSLNGSKQLITSESIPFMSMVLHGCVNYAGSATNMSSSLDIEVLDIIKNGASPYFIIATQNTRYLKENEKLSGYYSVDYSTWKEDMIETYMKLNENLKDVQNAQFVEYGYIDGYRLPDADEKYAQFEETGAIIIKAIEDYEAAITRYERAVALYERFTVTEVLSRLNTADQKGVLDILGKYNWSATLEESRFESTDVKLTAEELATVETLLAEIGNYINYKGVAEFKKNITSAEKNLANMKEAYEKVMAQYVYLFNVKPGENGIYNANDFRILENFKGEVYEEDGKYVLASQGLVDEEGNPVKSLYQVGDKTIIKVGYDNGVEFYLNYNYYDVIVTINGQQEVIGAYDFFKVPQLNER